MPKNGKVNNDTRYTHADAAAIEPEDLERTHAEGRRRWLDNGRSGRDEDVDDDHQLPVLRPSCLFADADTDRFFFLSGCVCWLNAFLLFRRLFFYKYTKNVQQTVLGKPTRGQGINRVTEFIDGPQQLKPVDVSLFFLQKMLF